MHWSRRGADRLFQVRCTVYNGTLGASFGRRFFTPNDAPPKSLLPPDLQSRGSPDVMAATEDIVVSRGSRISASVVATRAAEPPLRQGGKIALLLQLKIPKLLILQKGANLYSYGL